MSFLAGLRRSWVSLALPGSDREGTYVDYDRMPDAADGVTDWAWLRKHAEAPGSEFAAPSTYAVADLAADIPGVFDVPDDLARFRAEPALRRRIPSATDAYFDLGDHVESVDGGRLLHLVSDSQWVAHWALYRGDEGTAMVATGYPVGFELGPEDVEAYADVPRDYLLVADTFAEFVWRWWSDHTIFYDVEVGGRAPTATQRAYLAGYRPPT